MRNKEREVDIQVELITPEKAREYLGFNTHNRNLRPGVVTAYATDMANDDWLWNGEAIKFDSHGVLLDGQHRLAAIAQSGKGVRILVVRGLPTQTQETLDGGAKRKFADALKLRGEKSYTTLATTVRGIYEWESGKRSFGSGTGPTNAQMSATLEKYPWIRDGVPIIHRASLGAGLPARAGGVAWWLFTQLDAEDADHFFTRLASEENHRSGEPAYELRKSIAVSLGTRGTRSVTYLLALTIKAWNKYRDGEAIGQLRFRRGGAKPEPFPEPH